MALGTAKAQPCEPPGTEAAPCWSSQGDSSACGAREGEGMQILLGAERHKALKVGHHG